jgi:hypothetical protein
VGGEGRERERRKIAAVVESGCLRFNPSGKMVAISNRFMKKYES